MKNPFKKQSQDADAPKPASLADQFKEEMERIDSDEAALKKVSKYAETAKDNELPVIGRGPREDVMGGGKHFTYYTLTNGKQSVILRMNDGNKYLQVYCFNKAGLSLDDFRDSENSVVHECGFVVRDVHEFPKDKQACITLASKFLFTYKSLGKCDNCVISSDSLPAADISYKHPGSK